MVWYLLESMPEQMPYLPVKSRKIIHVTMLTQKELLSSRIAGFSARDKLKLWKDAQCLDIVDTL